MEARPNLLIIHAHDLGRHTSVYGAGVATPALERFTERSMVFSNAWSCAPTCSPSRAALLTGRYPHEVGMLGLAHLGFALERTDLHISTELREAGYETLLAGVQHEVPDHRMLSYDRTIGADPHAPYLPTFDPPTWDRENAEAVGSFLQHTGRRTNRAPWFLFWGLFAPHRPFDTVPASDGAVAAPAGLPDTAPVRQEYAAFRETVHRMDALIGGVLTALEDGGHGNDTMVVITSDHGIDFPRYKCTLSPGGLGVQLMIRRPGQQEAMHTAALVSTVDVLPTIRAELGLPARDPTAARVGTDTAYPTVSENAETVTDTIDSTGVRRGRSLLPLWQNPVQSVRRHAAAEMNYHVAYDPARSVFDGRYHLVRHYGEPRVVAPNIGDSRAKDAVLSGRAGEARSPQMVPPREGLFDLWFDPLQNNNLLDTGSETGRKGRSTEEALPLPRLKRALERWMDETDDPLLSGTVPAPAGAAVAPRDAYSSTAADVIFAERKEPHS